MSTVDKMLIKGIRSFDPENKNVITFFKPLTLIVGPNGAGKTTIIECLKLSCTGELPPNARSGHSFIHDPKVSGETETKGQIKLRFKTAAGRDVVCIRSFQLTQKASKMEYKAIESVLQTINPHSGEKVCLSYRCADMDREIPALMGVSKAILENVIFVHQDEANWPLQDPSTLKKKFDDIFSATRYTKALEVIKKLHKDQAQEIKTYKLKLENLQTLKDAAYTLRESITHDQEKTESLKDQIHQLGGSIKDLDTKIDHAEKTSKHLLTLKEQINAKTTERSTLFKEQQDKHAALEEEYEETDEELMEMKTNFDEKIAVTKKQIGNLEREKGDISTKSVCLKKTVDDSIWEISKLQTEAEAHMSLKKERDTCIQNIFARYNLGSLPKPPFSTEDALNLTNRVKSRLGDLEKDLDDKKKANNTELQMAWDCYLSANESWQNTEAKIQTKREIKVDIIKRIEEKKNKLDSLELQISNINFSQLDERERDLQIRLERKIKQHEESEFEQKKSQNEIKIHNVEQKIKAVNRELVTMASDSKDREKLSILKGGLETKKKQHKKIIDDQKDNIRRVLKGRIPSDKDLKKEITQSSRAVAAEYDELNANYRELDKEVNVLQMKIQEVDNSLSKHHKDMESRKRFIESKLQSLDQQFSGIDSYLKVLESAKEKRDVQKSKYNIADGMRQMFDPFERVARAHHFCPCCERSFSVEEEDNFVKKQRVKAASSAEHMKALAVESSSADSDYQQLDKLRMWYEEYVKLGKETIPNAEKELQQRKEELDHKSQALDDVLGSLAQVKTEKDLVDIVVQHVENADRHFQEIQTLQSDVEDLESRLDYGGPGARTLEEIQSELTALQGTKDKLHAEMKKMMEDDSEMEKHILNFTARLNHARNDKNSAAIKLQEVKRLGEELEHLTEEMTQVDLDEKSLLEAVGPLSKRKDKLLADYDELKSRLDNEHENLVGKKRLYQQQAEDVFRVTSKIKEYSELMKGDRLKELQEKKSLLESQLQSCETRMQKIIEELDKKKELMRDADPLKRRIEDNLNYRKTKAKVDKLLCEIEILEESMLKVGVFDTIEKELQKLSKERERLLEESNRCKGTMDVYQSNISKNKIDLKQAQYKDIDKRYFDQLIQLKTTEMANKDLDRYYNALDKALMRFHTMKMEEINKIIRELWQQTYRGQDIDCISIHSDSEGGGTRSYSYKVLASLIIRLALAETFCLNCGILALDEPTTNLDGPNAESLAAAILRIMEDRKGQENFQLIVITHDERFAQLIGQRQHAERYYRVAKDDHQHSIIESQEIFD
ncbi:hypothetical protein TSUD_326460 [Trifolium subterraneum]|uniref:DNA repair protein RAD50 n=1 Tax=Trifolium subterraneum TaxID=3900 RepID=A0A2Z6PE80_TRISU|nr:hypothetical protein TSUD_326460 [Trifolium subterraneum]